MHPWRRKGVACGNSPPSRSPGAPGSPRSPSRAGRPARRAATCPRPRRSARRLAGTPSRPRRPSRGGRDPPSRVSRPRASAPRRPAATRGAGTPPTPAPRAVPRRPRARSRWRSSRCRVNFRTVSRNITRYRRVVGLHEAVDASRLQPVGQRMPLVEISLGPLAVIRRRDLNQGGHPLGRLQRKPHCGSGPHGVPRPKQPSPSPAPRPRRPDRSKVAVLVGGAIRGAPDSPCPRASYCTTRNPWRDRYRDPCTTYRRVAVSPCSSTTGAPSPDSSVDSETSSL